MSKFPRSFRAFAAICCVQAFWLPHGEALEAASSLTVAIVPAAADGAEKAPETARPTRVPEVRCAYLITVSDDFIVAAYKNGELIPETKRKLLLDRFGATAEKIEIEVRADDWLGFNVAHNPVRWGGTSYFAVAGCFAPNEFGFVSEPGSPKWSVCDDPAKSGDFIRQRDAGRDVLALPIKKPWGEGDRYIRELAGKDFKGKAIWGQAASTWIKFVARDAAPVTDVRETISGPEGAPKAPDVAQPRQWPVQILSAIYGTGGKDADVTAKVKEYVETLHRKFSANPRDLGKDPNPYWNKSLHIVYMKDGVRREQRRNENETVLPESFYGPQDAAELRTWLAESRWTGEHGEIQFHPDGTFTSSLQEGSPRWEAKAAKKLRLIWSADHTLDFEFDYTWSGFSEVENGRNVYHLVK